MGAVTYPNEKVIKFVDYNFVPVQIEVSNKALVEQFKVNWTPAIFVLDASGNEVHRVVGFLPPEEFIPTFMMAKGKWYFNAENFAEAQNRFQEVVRKYPDSDAAAEAVFFLGVSRFKESHDPKPLREAYETLTAKFPGSEWAKRAAPYRLIEA
ncbi:MAG: thioredoxin fold domain-containing protein [Deltaproteobacteria bacterium]|jgi:tetratricopeptide (TPR) repeat protein